MKSSSLGSRTMWKWTGWLVNMLAVLIIVTASFLLGPHTIMDTWIALSLTTFVLLGASSSGAKKTLLKISPRFHFSCLGKCTNLYNTLQCEYRYICHISIQVQWIRFTNGSCRAYSYYAKKTAVAKNLEILIAEKRLISIRLVCCFSSSIFLAIFLFI